MLKQNEKHGRGKIIIIIYSWTILNFIWKLNFITKKLNHKTKHPNNTFWFFWSWLTSSSAWRKIKYNVSDVTLLQSADGYINKFAWTHLHRIRVLWRELMINSFKPVSSDTNFCFGFLLWITRGLIGRNVKFHFLSRKTNCIKLLMWRARFWLIDHYSLAFAFASSDDFSCLRDPENPLPFIFFL